MSELDIEHLAKIARIRLSKVEKEKFMRQLQNIIEYCSKLEAVDVDGIEPMVHSFEQDGNVWGEEDSPEMREMVDFLTQNAPEIKENQVVVPKVL